MWKYLELKCSPEMFFLLGFTLLNKKNHTRKKRNMNKKYLHDFTPEKIFCCIFTRKKNLRNWEQNNLFCLTHDSPEPVC